MQVTAQNKNVTVTLKELPFGNKIVASNAKIVMYGSQEELHLTATCTAASREPGRKYACMYSLNGTMLECYTLN